ncbi:MAG: Glucose-1-phosphate thymidylyltransferase [Candidatus Moranbacteria bacterium GW2011_GWE1_36_7]|nr:MAG: Glucose-1-phosphate thymidylyltransferase [Candidatus Moranbacteria bacterium GW2011_GWD2_36_12]KKQ06318.1 MAG: Glucose-1-phosphate thymidylyltransferase [Candidatus Moranbacteria bacterium GW2011_GWE2_36_40]KKQ13979.1 MAG: Glucose-1-phosphate thymidylyltransferase [Candidatus Moranbacteria bacterium GW2011_GWE1_36_7]
MGEITKPKKRKMKGIVLAGGTATRLFPMTATTSKQLLPVYDRQMIFYPLNTLIKAGIKNILIIVAPEHSGQFLNLLGSLLKKHDVHITFEVQSSPRGLAEALTLGENHIGDDNVALILGDNIFEDDFAKQIKEFRGGGHIFATKVPDPERFGVVKFNKNNKAVEIVEKPKEWISDWAVTGLYLYDNRCVEIAKKMKPSDRGEIEITDVNREYLKKKELEVTLFGGEWLDAGTPDSLLEASIIVKEKGISRNFHPILDQAINELNEELRIRSKKRLQ